MANHRFDVSLDGFPGPFFEADREGTILDYHMSQANPLGIADQKVDGKTLGEVLPEAAWKAIHQAMEQAGGNRIISSEPFSLETPSGTGWFETSIAARGEPEGAGAYYTIFIHDVTRHKQVEQQLRSSLAEKDLLLKELHHRVKNNLQVIVSLLNLQADSFQDSSAVEAFHEAQNRVKAIAFVHECLYQSPDLERVDFADYIDTLVDRLFKSYGIGTDHISLAVHVSNIRLNIHMAIPCGLIINELVSNCLKHAFPDGRKGNIQVEMQPDGSFISLGVRDNGIGLPEDYKLKKAGSLGLQLVDILVEQLQGSLVVDRSLGTSFRVTFPVGHW